MNFYGKNRDAEKENKAIQQKFNPLIDIKDWPHSLFKHTNNEIHIHMGPYKYINV